MASYRPQQERKPALRAQSWREQPQQVEDGALLTHGPPNGRSRSEGLQGQQEAGQTSRTTRRVTRSLARGQHASAMNPLATPFSPTSGTPTGAVTLGNSNQFHTQGNNSARASTRRPPQLVRKVISKGSANHQVRPPIPPEATRIYLAQSLLPPVTRSTAQRLLVVLDLNGTLIARNRQTGNFKERPGLENFLRYIFEYHVPMIYTSARPENAQKICQALFGNRQSGLAAIWGRDKLGLTHAQYREKVQVYKRLEVVWADKKIQAQHPDKGSWTQANTVLVDDSVLKGLAQPHNLLLVREFERSNAATETETVLRELVLKLEELKMQSDVSRLIRRWQAGTHEAPRPPSQQPGEQTSLTTWLTEGCIRPGVGTECGEALPQTADSIATATNEHILDHTQPDADDLSVDEDDDDDTVQKELASQMAQLQTGKGTDNEHTTDQRP